MKTKPCSVVDEIVAMLPSSVGPKPWYERVSKDEEEMLAAIIAGWKAGRFGAKKNPAARTISAYLAKHGVKIGRPGVISWLAKHDAM